MPPRTAVIYYSSTSRVHALATAVAGGAIEAGAEVRLRRVAETAPAAAIESNPAWLAHHRETRDTITEAAHEDVEWATGFAFGTPAGYGLPAAQLNGFLDGCSPLWREGKLKDKVATILALNNVFYHWGSIIVPPDSSHPDVIAAGGNPYGTSFPSGRDGEDIPDVFPHAAYLQGARLAHFAQPSGRSMNVSAHCHSCGGD